MTRSNAFVAALLALSLVACGGQGKSASTANTGTDTGSNSGSNAGTDDNTNTGTDGGSDGGTGTDGGTGGTDDGGGTGTGPTLLSLSLTPSADSGPLGHDVQFTATGIFSDATTEDLTASTTWASDDSTVATFSTAGVLHPVAQGTVTVTAISGAITASTTFTVTGAALEGFAVVPDTSTIAQFTTAPLQAIGYYSDGTSINLSDVADWSSDPAILELSKSIGLDGEAIALAKGISVGSATVTASFGGFSDTATVIVTSATLESIAADPPSIALPFGLSQQVTLTGTFFDAATQTTTTQDLTALAAWTSLDPSVATVSNDAGSTGLVSLIAPGSTTVTATVSVGAITLAADISVVVSNAFVESIVVTPDPATLPAGYKRQFTAVATFSDDSVLDVTKAAIWTSSDASVATVSTTSPTKGVATGIAVGTTTLTATLGNVHGSASLTVSNARLVRLVVTPADSTVEVGGHQQLTAIGTFDDGSTLDLTTQCSWRSKDKHVAWVSKAGVVTGTASGSTSILGRKRNIRADLVSVTVP